MTMLSPAATYHAELREQLGGVGRALSLQRGVCWLARGLAAGTLPVLGLVIWAWTSDSVSSLSIPLLVAMPVGAGVLASVASLFIRHRTPELARRVDRAARLHERSTTALELGARGEEFPLAIAQMRDAVEHLKRVDLLEAFPLHTPRNELLTTFFVVLVAAIVGISPNPWLLRARASNPAITIAHEQAERVQRVADSIQPASPELDALRQQVSKGAQTIQAHSDDPDAALNALQDLEAQVRQMSAGDDQLAAALAAIAGALGANQSTQQLADAINTGDMRQIAQASKALAAASASMSSQDKQRLAAALRNAAQAASSASQSVAGNLSDAADALQGSSASASADGSPANSGQAGQTSQGGQSGQQDSGSQSAQAASDALNQLSNSAAAAGERQRTASQLESSRNALERALGRTQSRSGSSSSGSSSSSRSTSSSSQDSQSSNGGQRGDQSQAGDGQGQSSSQSGDGTGGSPGANPGGDQGNGSGDTGQGGGYSTGGQGQDHSGASPSSPDLMTSPQQVPSNGAFSPDQSSTNPYLGQAGSSSAQTQPESVNPSYSNQPAQGNDSGSIPLGMRDLVKDYFSSLDQK